MKDRSEKLLDNTSWRILAILQENARIPFKELGKQVKLSAPAVAERVRRLEDAGIITRYRVELNLEKLGLPILAFVTFRAFPDKCEELKLLLHESPEVRSSYRITGSDHYLAKVSVAYIGHLEQLVDRFIPYATITTSIVLSTTFEERAVDKDVFK